MAFQFYVTIEGTKQGKFKGGGRGSKIVGLEFSYEVTSPRDAASGQPSGKRQHHPVVITKEWDASTPQIFQALVTNEVLKSVVLEFIRTAPQGKEEVFYTVTLTNGAVADVRQFFQGEAPPGQPAGPRDLEDVSFTFQKIELENVPGKTVAVDDWATQA